MNKTFIKKNFILLHNYNPTKDEEPSLEREVIVSVNSVYSHIAKYNQNPSRDVEIALLKETLNSISNKHHYDSKYTTMKLSDALVCFDKKSKRIHRTTSSRACVKIAKK